MRFRLTFFIVFAFSVSVICTSIIAQDFSKPFKILNKHTDGVTALCFSPDGKILVTGSMDKTMLIWNTSTWESSKPLTGHTNAIQDIKFLPSGTKFYSGGDYFVRSWNLNGKETEAVKGPTTYIWSIAVKPDSSQWVAGSYEKNMRLYNTKTGKLTLLTGHQKSTLAVDFSADGKWMASGSLDERIFLGNAETYQIVDTLTGCSGNIYCVRFSPDGKYLASASNDNIVRIWDVKTGKLLRNLKGHTAGVFSVAFSNDGNYLVSGSVDTNVLIWEICNGELLATLSGHTQAVNEVAFYPSGEFIASASLDKTVALWSFTHELIVMHYFENEINKEKDQSALFLPRTKDESKSVYQQRLEKAKEFNRQLVEIYYNQYLASLKGIWK